MSRGKAAKSLALIDASYDILSEIHPCSVRAVCYRLFVRQVIPGMQVRHTKRVSEQLVYAREHDIIPWDWIVDPTRQLAATYTWDSPEAYTRDILNAYRPNRWVNQPARVEVWSEKSTVSGTLQPVLDTYAVGFQVAHGFSGAAALHECAVRSASDLRPLTVLYLGDWDPSGMYMSETDLPKRLARYQGNVTLVRLAIDANDMHPDAGLPAFSVLEKLKDSWL